MNTKTAFALLALVLLLTSCHRQPQPIVVQVLRNAEAGYARSLEKTSYDFVLTKPRLGTGRDVLVGTMEVSNKEFVSSFKALLNTRPEIVILQQQPEIQVSEEITQSLGEPSLVCGGSGVAYIPIWASEEKREAAELYLHFVQLHCDKPNGGT